MEKNLKKKGADTKNKDCEGHVLELLRETRRAGWALPHSTFSHPRDGGGRFGEQFLTGLLATFLVI